MTERFAKLSQDPGSTDKFISRTKSKDIFGSMWGVTNKEGIVIFKRMVKDLQIEVAEALLEDGPIDEHIIKTIETLESVARGTFSTAQKNLDLVVDRYTKNERAYQLEISGRGKKGTATTLESENIVSSVQQSMVGISGNLASQRYLKRESKTKKEIHFTRQQRNKMMWSVGQNKAVRNAMAKEILEEMIKIEKDSAGKDIPAQLDITKGFVGQGNMFTQEFLTAYATLFGDPKKDRDAKRVMAGYKKQKMPDEWLTTDRPMIEKFIDKDDTWMDDLEKQLIDSHRFKLAYIPRLIKRFGDVMDETTDLAEAKFISIHNEWKRKYGPGKKKISGEKYNATDITDIVAGTGTGAVLKAEKSNVNAINEVTRMAKSQRNTDAGRLAILINKGNMDILRSMDDGRKEDARAFREQYKRDFDEQQEAFDKAIGEMD